MWSLALLLLLLVCGEAHSLHVTEAEKEASCPTTTTTPTPTYAVYGAFGELGQQLIDLLMPNEDDTQSTSSTRKIRVICKPGQPHKPPSSVDPAAAAKVIEYVEDTDLAAAFHGVAGAFIIPHVPYTSSEFMAESNQTFSAVLSAARMQEVPKLVVLSAMGAQLDPASTGTIAASHYHEHLIREQQQPSSVSSYSQVYIVRSPWNVDNFRALARQVAKQQRVMPSFFHDKLEVEMISNLDLAWCMAQFMLNEHLNENGGSQLVQVREVAMKTPYTSHDIARAVGRVLMTTGEDEAADVKPVGIPRDVYGKLFKYMGPSALKHWEASILAYNAGVVQFEHPASVLRVKSTLDEVVGAWFEQQPQPQGE